MFVKWDIIKEKIKNTRSKLRGVDLIEDLDKNLTLYPIEKLNRILDEYKSKSSLTKLDNYIINKLNYLIDFRNKYYIRTPYHNLISVKLVLPIGCQANCQFCYYNDDKNLSYKMYHSKEYKEKFLENFVNSLIYINKRAHGKPLSLDITGGEPTSNLELLSKVMLKIKEAGIKSLFKRITLTSNGYKALEALPIISGVVDYLNISLHSIDFDARKSIFKTNNIPSNEELDDIIFEAYKNDIKVSSVFVKDNLEKLEFDKINEWASNKGFVTNRIRFNVFKNCHKNKFANKLLNESLKDSNYTEIYSESAEEADFSIVAYKNNMLIFIMDGIPETYDKTYGIEILVRQDGLAYIDYSGKTLLKDVEFLPINYVCTKK